MPASIKAVVLALAVLFTAANAQAYGPPSWAGRGSQTPAFTGTSLTDSEKADVLHMREEEKLARDVYITLGEKWGAALFSNISNSEQRHMDAVAALITYYSLEDPAAGKGVGEFTSSDMQTLYDQLTAQGGQSLTEAYQVGATIEDLDIFDLEAALAGASNPDVTRVFQNLLSGSENHMRAFVNQLAALGATYQAQYISADRLAEILSSSWNRGRRWAQ